MGEGAQWLEASWLHSSDPDTLIRFAMGRSSDRKLRLFACACGRRLEAVAEGVDVEHLELVERIADHQDSDSEELQLALSRAEDRYIFGGSTRATGLLWSALQTDTNALGISALSFLADVVSRLDQHQLIREVFGNPFRPVDFSAWRTDAAVALARQMYDSRDFGAMPILADALQEAGCDNADVLSHCRDAAQTHFRGCWVVDGVLGLE